MARALPPEAAAYQSTVSPASTVALIEGTGPPIQYDLLPSLRGAFTDGQEQTGAVTARLLMQLFPSVTVTVIPVPVLTPLIVHKLPLVLTALPEVVVTAPELTVTPTEYVNRSGAHVAGVVTVIAGKELTVIVIPEEVAGLPDVQVMPEVKTHVTTSLFDNVLFIYVAEFDPTLFPFSFHW